MSARIHDGCTGDARCLTSSNPARWCPACRRAAAPTPVRPMGEPERIEPGRPARFPWRHRLASWLIRKEAERVYRQTGGAHITISHTISRTTTTSETPT